MLIDQTRSAIPVFIVDTSGNPIAALGTPVDGNLSREDVRVLAAAGYTVSTSVLAVAAGNYLIAELANPAGSGVNFVMSSRILANNITGGNTPLEYQRFATTATLAASPLPTSVAVGNRIAGGSAIGTFRYQMGATLPTGTVTSSGFLPTNGSRLEIKEIVVIPPGGKLIYAIGGSGGGLMTTARCAMTFLFYTNPV